MESEVRYYSARELAETVGCTRKALRVYQAKGLITPARSTGNRRYTSDMFERLRFVVALRDVGLPVDDIRELLLARDRPTENAGEVAQALVEQISELIPRITNKVRHLLLTRDELIESRETLRACATCGRSLEHCTDCVDQRSLDSTSAMLMAGRTGA